MISGNIKPSQSQLEKRIQNFLEIIEENDI
jgi:hypothetical protein